MRVGLPSALINPYYIVFWKTFFDELGVDTIESGVTTKDIVNLGVRHSVPEICIPVKIYTGHVVELLNREVDFIYIPRLITAYPQETFCPKFLGLPDMLKCTVPGLENRLMTHQICSKTDDIANEANYMDIGKMFTTNTAMVKKAIRRGKTQWLEFRKLCYSTKYNCKTAAEKILNGKTRENARTSGRVHPVKIGVIGYVYNIYDNFISMDILTRLSDLGVTPVTFEMLEQSVMENHLRRISRNLFWTFTNKLQAAAYHFFEDPEIAGVIHVTAFGCGPDSFLGKILEIDSAHYAKPFLTVRVDEHTGESHLQTRVEAFADMILKNNRRTEYVS